MLRLSPLVVLAGLLASAPVLGHPGHGAPSLHQHAGEPSPLVLLGVAALASVGLSLLGRVLLRRLRARSPH
ncbi:hypothetical protein [Halomonas nitroreducens]|uniref:Uncharacterized protein n=1 Tax=Halomonas nitroreducens TaxID=447425 RepID=A0A431V0J5_9GAMM|nr:hypothetical protein [Halomonas nitroreducens]RTR00205.1 hypothetical protein EKG36_16410 [Halomonas nitroreducens]